MARKEMITKQMVLDSAFELASRNGYREVTARKLASFMGCSTQPIFRLYDNMELLLKDYTGKAVSFFHEFYDSFPRNNEEPFVDLGLAYISFAGKYPNLFELLFMARGEHKLSLYETLNGENGNLSKEIRKASANGCSDSQNLFMRMWIFIHGAASMTLTGDYDLDEDATARMLIATYYAYTK